jgi:hypothetical protein
LLAREIIESFNPGQAMRIVAINSGRKNAMISGMCVYDIWSLQLSYKAELDNGNPLPRWIQFQSNNNQTLLFSGTPSSAGDTRLRLVATDPSTASDQADFTITTIASGSSGGGGASKTPAIAGAVAGGVTAVGACCLAAAAAAAAAGNLPTIPQGPISHTP